MSETSTMFLTLTPAMHQVDSPQHPPGPIDHVTLKLAVESLSYRLASGDMFGSLSNSLKAAPIASGAVTNPGNSTPTDENTAEMPSADDMTTESASVENMSTSSVEKHIDSPVLPPAQNDKQDTVADEQDTVPDKPAVLASSLPTKLLSPATVLKHRLQNTKDLIVCPGVYDGFSARIALSVGFDALYMVSNIFPRRPLHCYSHELDRCRHNRLSPWTTRSGPRTAE